MDARAKKAQQDIADLKQKLNKLEESGPKTDTPEINALQSALADIDAKKADTQKKLEEVQARIKANKEKLAAMKARK
jgi:chromosome segregation ATPase